MNVPCEEKLFLKYFVYRKIHYAMFHLVLVSYPCQCVLAESATYADKTM